jgi:hypothetical protein
VEGKAGIDSSAWPLVVMRIPARFDVPAIDDFTRAYDEVLGRREKFALITDTTAMTSFPNALERQRIVEHWRARTFSERAYNQGTAIVMTSVAARAVFTALMWVRPAIVPQTIVGTFVSAVEWCCGRFAGAGIALSPAIEALRLGAEQRDLARRSRRPPQSAG